MLGKNSLIQKFHDTVSSLKNTDYRLYFIGSGISSIGMYVQTTAQAWIVLKLTNSGVALGIVLALQFLPYLIFSPIGGLLVDRYSKHKIIFITSILSAILAIVMGMLVLTDTIALWMIYLLALLLGLVGVIENPARHALISEIVKNEDLLNAVTLNSIQYNLARVIGPIIAGALILTLGIYICFFVNALSFIAVIICLLMMAKIPINSSKSIENKKGQITEAFNYSRKNPVIFHILFMMAIIGTLTYEFHVTLPMLAEFVFNGSAKSYALLTAAFGFGAVIGGVYTAGMKKIDMPKLVFVSIMFGIFIIITASAANFIFALISLIFCGFFSIMFSSIGRTMLQLETKPNMRGRVLSFWNIMLLGSTVIGAPIIGFIGQYFGARLALATSGFAAIIASIIGVFILNEVHIHNKKKLDNQIITELDK